MSKRQFLTDNAVKTLNRMKVNNPSPTPSPVLTPVPTPASSPISSPQPSPVIQDNIVKEKALQDQLKLLQIQLRETQIQLQSAREERAQEINRLQEERQKALQDLQAQTNTVQYITQQNNQLKVHLSKLIKEKLLNQDQNYALQIANNDLHVDLTKETQDHANLIEQLVAEPPVYENDGKYEMSTLGELPDDTAQ